jgi:hypothetical protein
MTRFLSLYRAGLFVPLLLICTSLHAQTINTFDPPNSTYTIASAINPTGEITGYYSDASGPQHGFLRKRDGTLITFDVELHGIFPSNASPVDINAAGQITGYYRVEAIVFGSFLRQADGTIVVISPPNPNQDPTAHDTARTSSAATSQGPRPFCPIDGSAALSINAIGQITGGYAPFLCSGFLRQPDGTVASFDVRSERHPEDSPDTQPQAINLFGQITGFYFDNGIIRGFLRQPNGGIVRFDPTNSISTIPMAINLLGQITGYYEDTSSVVHSFLRQPCGTVITFDLAGSTDTEAKSINVEGDITGFYLGSDGAYHGFVRKRHGTFTTFDAPNSQGTFPQSINLVGQITGYYFDGSSFHGFVRDK